MDLTGPDYELTWPSAVFVAETRALEAVTDWDWSNRVESLLEDVFAGPVPRDHFKAAANRGILPGGGDGQRAFLQELVVAAPTLTLADEPRPYYPQRQTAVSAPLLDPDFARRSFVRLVADLRSRGYLERVFPSECVDDRDFVAVNESDLLEERLGVPDLWPLERSEATWDADTFYGLIEVIHDVVARPRARQWHDYSNCGWHYSEFAVAPARELYRWRVNRLLDRTTIPLRLAGDGEDVGRLVATTDEARTDLVQRLLRTTEPTAADRVRHAIALYRSRGASDEDKRSAIVALAGVLEDRRAALKANLFRKDEDALFEIANRFSIRHHNESQKSDYDPVFLDWIFWWFAATVELTERLLARTSG